MSVINLLAALVLFQPVDHRADEAAHDCCEGAETEDPAQQGQHG